jgi:hypothetical protein
VIRPIIGTNLHHPSEAAKGWKTACSMQKPGA